MYWVLPMTPGTFRQVHTLLMHLQQQENQSLRFLLCLLYQIQACGEDEGRWRIDINGLMVYSMAGTQEGLETKGTAHMPNRVRCLRFTTHKLRMRLTTLNNRGEKNNIVRHMNMTCTSKLSVQKGSLWDFLTETRPRLLIYVLSVAASTTTTGWVVATETKWPKGLNIYYLTLYRKSLATYAPDVWWVNEWINEQMVLEYDCSYHTMPAQLNKKSITQ